MSWPCLQNLSRLLLQSKSEWRNSIEAKELDYHQNGNLEEYFMVEQSPDAEALEMVLKFIKAFSMSLFAFEITNSAGLLAVISIALYVGKEYMSGTIRNKIIAGHSRTAVYSFAFVVSAISAIVSIVTMLWGASSMPSVASLFMKTVYMGQLTFLSTDFSAGFFLTTLASSIAMVCVISAIGTAVFKRLDLN